MIESRNDIQDLLHEYLKIQHDYFHQWWMDDVEQWSGKRQANYTYGIVIGMFRDNDIHTLQALTLGVSDNALQNEICIYYKREIIERRKAASSELEKKMILDCWEKSYQQLSKQAIDDWIKEHLKIYYEIIPELLHSDMRVLLYLHYAFLNFNYEKKHMYNSDQSNLMLEYVNIFDKQSQFHKYGIIPIDGCRTLLAIDPPRMYDSSTNKTYFIKNIPLDILKELSDMKSKKIISDLAVRLRDEPGYSGKMDSGYLAEALERGKVFDLVNLGSYSVSKLYSTNYENCLWVVIDSENITFEELCEDFDSYEDMVVTQVVHLQYMSYNEKTYITHLDHEYVFYTIDEYEIRMCDVKQKGTAKPRMKSFKIDNSMIPFDYKCEIFRKDQEGNDLPPAGEQFLCYVLECYFKHKDLLNEYFQKVYTQYDL